MSTRPSEGKIKFVYNGEEFQTYYKVYGDLAKRGGKHPLIVLHGGPGLVHDYLVAHADLALKHDTPVILYDQIGNGKSTHLKGKGPEFWTMELFIAELENLIKHFGIQGGFDLLGHSWGGMVASEYAVRKQSSGLKHLVLTNSLASYALWTESTVQLLQQMPEDVQQGVMGGLADLPKFWAAIQKFYAYHGCLVQPFPKEFLGTLEQVFGPNGDLTVTASPLLANWPGIIDRLHLVRVPTFVINGRKDIAQDFVVQPFFDKIQKVKWVTLENSSHTPFLEERDRYIGLVADFLAL